jgi:DNA-binding NarL/FixJ family response regulator
MVSVSLAGIDDAALESAMAELAIGVGAALATGHSLIAADLVLVLVTTADQLGEHLDRARAHAPSAALVVLVPFLQPRLTTRALALGAAACHCLDQPLEHLSAILRSLLGVPKDLPASAGGA